jgi:YegS/Rv2252/BmrU family lipid kinase
MIRFIVNPHAAGGSTRARWSRLEPAVRERFPDAGTLWTKARGDARRLAEAAVREGCSLIVAVGGDGTISEVVDGMLRADPRVSDGGESELGIIPSGTGGDLIRSLAVPLDPLAALNTLTTTQSRRIDVGKIRYQGAAGNEIESHFVNVADAGLGGETVQSIDSFKRLPGTLAYFSGTVAAMLRHRPRAVRIWIDDEPEPMAVDAGVVAVANGRFFGGGMCISPQSHLDDGYLDLIAIPYRAPSRSLGLFRKIYRGRVLTDRAVTSRRVRRLRIEPVDPVRPVLLDVDGEQPGALPAAFEVLPLALSVRA